MLNNCIIGICDAAPIELDAAPITPFVSRDYSKRTDPAANMPGAKSIIVVGVPYTTKDIPPMPECAGVLSVLGVVDDYHNVVRTLLKRLVCELQRHTSFKYKILVDSPTLDERALAVRAGLGFLGRNGLVISPEYGSRFNLGLMLTDIEVTSFPAIIETLGLTRNPSHIAACPPNCRSCINTCPTGALSTTGNFDVSRCISYLTQKDNLTPEEAVLIGRHLYGCDICQDACEYNTPQPTAWANPAAWLLMSDEDFSNTYGHTAMLWRGTELLKRNACIAIKNML